MSERKTRGKARADPPLGLSGVELAVRVREGFQSCKVILFSGQAATMDILEAAARRGHQFEVLLKPVHPRDLLARLEMGDGFEAGYAMAERLSA